MIIKRKNLDTKLAVKPSQFPEFDGQISIQCDLVWSGRMRNVNKSEFLSFKMAGDTDFAQKRKVVF
jgi:hypothetical protein